MVLATHDYIQTFTAIADDIPAFRSVQDYNYWRAMNMPDTLVGFKEGLHVLRHSSVKVLKTFLMYAVDWPRDPHIHTWLPWVDYLREFVLGIDLNKARLIFTTLPDFDFYCPLIQPELSKPSH